MKKELNVLIEKQSKGTTVFKLEGSLNSDTKDRFSDSLLDFKYESKNFIFIIDQLVYISSSGVGIFMELYERVNDRGGKICFVGMTETVKNVFDYIGFSSFFGNKNHLQEAEDWIYL